MLLYDPELRRLLATERAAELQRSVGYRQHRRGFVRQVLASIRGSRIEAAKPGRHGRAAPLPR